jgi:hypothetical protein
MRSYLHGRLIKCGQCQKDHAIPPIGGRRRNRTVYEILELVQSIPTVAQWRKSLERNEALVHMMEHEATPTGAVKKEKVIPCVEERCTSDATHLCTECGNQCDSCQKKAHSTPAGASHMCVSFVEQKRKKQLAVEAAAEARLSRYGPFIAALSEYDVDLADPAFAVSEKAWTGEADHHRWSVACVVSCRELLTLAFASCCWSAVPCRRIDTTEGGGCSESAAGSDHRRVEPST